MRFTTLRAVVFTVFAAGLLALPAQAQRSPGAVGFGAQAGAPTGVTLKVHNNASPSYDFLAAWDTRGDFFLFNAHAQFSETLNTQNVDSGEFEWFIGPGAFVGTFGDNDYDDDFDDNGAVIGVSGRTGLNYGFANNFEVFAQVTPRLSLVPGTDFDVGGGLGLRFYP
jgi:hypothetical protein